jgi:hypothetical protein
VHGSNARNLLVWLSLSQLAKTLCLSYYCLCLLFNKIGEKDRTGSAWKPGRGMEGEGGGEGQRGEMAQTMCAHMNEWINKKNLHTELFFVISLVSVVSTQHVFKVSPCFRMHFLFMDEKYSITCAWHIRFLQSSVKEHLFRVLTFFGLYEFWYKHLWKITCEYSCFNFFIEYFNMQICKVMYYICVYSLEDLWDYFPKLATSF